MLQREILTEFWYSVRKECIFSCFSLPTDGGLEYQAQSPDEGALVSAARNFGFVFKVTNKLYLFHDFLCSDFVWQIITLGLSQVSDVYTLSSLSAFTVFNEGMIIIRVWHQIF